MKKARVEARAFCELAWLRLWLRFRWRSCRWCFRWSWCSRCRRWRSRRWWFHRRWSRCLLRVCLCTGRGSGWAYDLHRDRRGSGRCMFDSLRNGCHLCRGCRRLPAAGSASAVRSSSRIHRPSSPCRCKFRRRPVWPSRYDSTSHLRLRSRNWAWPGRCSPRCFHNPSTTLIPKRYRHISYPERSERLPRSCRPTLPCDSRSARGRRGRWAHKSSLRPGRCTLRRCCTKRKIFEYWLCHQ